MLKNEALPKEWSGSVKGIKLYAGKEYLIRLKTARECKPILKKHI